ncbi:MAG: shikimate kinase [Anaerolineales bacterium]|nr:shikimate kinase [Anaerolineales bacterium]
MNHIFLYGPPGTGKSTIGKIIARNLKLPFIDLDRVIEINAGMSISQTINQQGESAFRDMETFALKNLVNENKSIVALGGGTLLRNENRAFAEENGKIILFVAKFSTLFERLQNKTDRRPLLAGDLQSKLTALLESRKNITNLFL